MNTKKSISDAASLRKRAEEQLKNSKDKARIVSSEADLLKLIHELQVHQIELELQNEELLLAKEREKLAKDKYTSLFDFAPSAYFTLSERGNITELNLAGALMLGKERQKLINSRLSLFIGSNSRVVFDDFLTQAFSGKNPASCEVNFVNGGNVPIYALLTGTLSDDGKHCLITATDITERKQAEELLRRKEYDLRESQRIAHVGSWHLDLATNQVVWTEELYNMYGFDPSIPPPSYTEHMKLFTPESWERLSTALALTRDTGIPYALELETIKKDGNHGWMWVRGEADVDSAGKTVALWGAAQDITGRKIAENELSSRNADLQLMNAINHAANVNENLTSIIDLIAKQLKVTFNSHLLSVFIPDEERREMRMYGNTLDNELIRKIEKITGKSIPQIVFRMDDENPFTEMEQSRKGLLSIGKKEVINRFAGYLKGTPWPVMVQKMVKKSLPAICDIIGYQSSAAVPMISKGTIIGYLELGSRDIMTESELARIKSIADHFATVIVKYTAERNLRESEERMTSAFNYASIGMAFVAPDGRWLNVNPAIPAMLGYTESELLSKTFQQITHPDDLPKDLDYRRQMLEGVINTYQREKRFFHKSGDIIWVSVSLSLVHDYEGKPLHFISQIQDITVLKNAFAELNKANEVLEFKVKERTKELNVINNFQKAILNNAPITIITTGLNGILQSINPAGELMTGYSADEVVGKITPLRFYEWDEIFEYSAKKTGNPGLSESDVFPSALEDMVNKTTEWHWVRKTGQKFSVKIILSSLMGSDRIVNGYLGLIMDVSKEKEYLDSLHKSESENRAIIRAVPDLMFRIHRDGTYLDSHSQNESSLYLPKELFIGKRINEVLPPELAAESMKAIENAFATGEVAQYEYTLPVNGKDSYFENRIISISDEEALSIIRDITVRKKLFLELAEEKRRLADIIKGTNAGTWEWNIQTGETIFNEQWTQMLGYTLDEISPVTIETWKKLSHPDDLITSDEQLNKHFRGEIEYYSCESRMKHKNGDWIWVLDRGRVHNWDSEGKPLLMSGTHQDITEQKRIENALQHAKNEAEKANLAKSEFLSRMSHELRTPMNSILGFAQLMEMGELNPKHKSGVKHILANGRHLLNLINEVLDISGIEAGRQIMMPEPILMKAIVNEITDLVQIAANKRRVSIELADSPANILFVLADRLRLKQVLINLLSNAVKYNKEGGSIAIHTALQPASEQGNTRIRISISDTGPGINSEDIGKLFQPFERIGASKTETEGTGLGLMVVKKLTEAMRGTVGVDSEAGVGSTFWIELPIAEPPKSDTSQSVGSPVPVLPELKKDTAILYIEDNQSNIELVEAILWEHRPDVRLKTSMFGKQTIKLAREYNPVLILLDLDLPDMQGIEVLGKLLADEFTKNIPVIIISADAMPFQVRKLMEAGAVAYLTKPLEVGQFLSSIDRYIKL